MCHPVRRVRAGEGREQAAVVEPDDFKRYVDRAVLQHALIACDLVHDDRASTDGFKDISRRRGEISRDCRMWDGLKRQERARARTRSCSRCSIRSPRSRRHWEPATAPRGPRDELLRCLPRSSTLRCRTEARVRPEVRGREE